MEGNTDWNGILQVPTGKGLGGDVATDFLGTMRKIAKKKKYRSNDLTKSSSGNGDNEEGENGREGAVGTGMC